MNIKNIFLVALFACPFLLAASNDKNKKIRLFSDAFENKIPDNNKKRKLLQQLVVAKYRNEKLPICNMPDDCWTVIAKYMPSHEKVSLRLVSSHFESLFYNSVTNGTVDQCSKIRIPLFTMPQLSSSNPNICAQKMRVANFINKTRIKKIVTKRMKDFASPTKVFLDTKNLDFSGTILSDMQLNILFSVYPNLKNLNLRGCKKFDSGLFFDERKLPINGINQNHPDFEKLRGLSSINMLSEAGRITKLQEVAKESPRFKEYFSLHEWFSLTQLEVLNLNETNVSSGKLQSVLKGCPQLKTLRLNNCKKLLLGDIDWNTIGGKPDLDAALKENIACFYYATTNKQRKIFIDLIQKQIPTLKTIPAEKRAEFMRNALKKNSVFYRYFDIIDWRNAKSLVELTLEKTFITAPELNQILSNCPGLQKLILKKSYGLSFNAIDWSKAKNLTTLDLSNLLITAENLQAILNNCPNLEILKLKGCKEPLLEEIDWSKTKKLTLLDLSGGLTISNSTLKNLGKGCPLLSTLLLSGQDSSPDAELDEKKFDWCRNLDWGLFKNLEVLNLGNSDFSSNDRIEKILRGCPKLTSLHGVLCTLIDDDEDGLLFEEVDKQLFNKITDLELYSADDFSVIGAAGLNHILKNCPLKKFICNLLLPDGIFDWSIVGNTLEELNLSDAGATVDELKAIMSHCIHLKKLVLKNSDGEGIGALNWSKLEELEYLDLSSSSLYKADLIVILKSCPNLKELLLGEDCSNLRLDNSLDWSRVKKLKHLKISGANDVSVEGLLAILKGCQSLSKLELEDNFGLDGIYKGGSEVFKELENHLIKSIENSKEKKEDSREIEEKKN